MIDAAMGTQRQLLRGQASGLYQVGVVLQLIDEVGRQPQHQGRCTPAQARRELEQAGLAQPRPRPGNLLRSIEQPQTPL
jgi:hypothetical protein